MLSLKGKILTTLALFAKSITLGCGSNFFPFVNEEMRIKLKTDEETISQIYKIFAAASLGGNLGGIIVFKFIRRQIGTMYVLVGISVLMFMIPNCSRVDYFLILVGILGVLVGMIVPGQIVWTMEMWHKQSKPILQALMFFFSVGSALPEYITAPFLMVHPLVLNGKENIWNETDIESTTVANINETMDSNFKKITENILPTVSSQSQEFSNIHIPFAIVGVMSFFNAWFERLLFKHFTYEAPAPPGEKGKRNEHNKDTTIKDEPDNLVQQNMQQNQNPAESDEMNRPNSLKKDYPCNNENNDIDSMEKQIIDRQDISVKSKSLIIIEEIPMQKLKVSPCKRNRKKEKDPPQTKFNEIARKVANLKSAVAKPKGGHGSKEKRNKNKADKKKMLKKYKPDKIDKEKRKAEESEDEEEEKSETDDDKKAGVKEKKEEIYQREKGKTEKGSLKSEKEKMEDNIEEKDENSEQEIETSLSSNSSKQVSLQDSSDGVSEISFDLKYVETDSTGQHTHSGTPSAVEKERAYSTQDTKVASEFSNEDEKERTEVDSKCSVEGKEEEEDDHEGYLQGKVQFFIKKAKQLKKIAMRVFKMLKKPENQKSIFVLMFSSFVLAAYAAIEKFSKETLSKLGQEGNLKLSEEDGEFVLQGFNMAFVGGRFAGMVMCLVVNPFTIMCADLSLIFFGNFTIIFGASFHMWILFGGCVLLGLGLSTLYAGLFTYVCGLIPFTDVIGAVLVITSTITTHFYANFIEQFIAGDSQKLITANYISGLVCTLSFKIIYTITKPKKTPQELENVVAV